MSVHYIQWPAKAESVKMIGYVHEIDGKDSPRDIGRPIRLGKNVYYVFGDTFCFDREKQYICLTNNTIALCPDRSRPLETQFLFQNHKGRQGHVRSFLPFSKYEEEFNRVNEKDMRRVVVWSFGGLIEDTPGCGQGWMFFEVQQTHGAIAEKSWGIGVCRVTQGATSMDVHVERVGGYIWGSNDPSFGSHSIFKDTDDTMYLLGGGENLQNFLASIPGDRDLTQRANYSYLSKTSGWISTYSSQSQLQALLPDAAQGAILKPAFAPLGKPYMYFGVGWWMKSKFYVAAAPRITGPWEMVDLTTVGRLNEMSQYRYCIYPHESSWNEETGELFCTWSEDGPPTRVIGGMIKFSTSCAADDWKKREGEGSRVVTVAEANAKQQPLKEFRA